MELHPVRIVPQSCGMHGLWDGFIIFGLRRSYRIGTFASVRIWSSGSPRLAPACVESNEWLFTLYCCCVLSMQVAGALNKVLSVNWEADTRIVLMVADAPCHGTSFHDCDDSHPGGDPSGLDPLHLIKEVARRGMDFYFIRCANIVDKMLTQFAAAFEGARANDNQIFSILDLQSQGGGGGYPSEDSLYSTPMPVPCGVPGSTGMPEVYRSMEASSFDISSLSVVDSEKEESAPRRCEAACSDDLVPRPAPSFERRRMEAPGAPPMASMSYAMPSSSFSAAMPMPMPSMMSSGGGGDLTSAYASAVTSSVKRSMAARAKPT